MGQGVCLDFVQTKISENACFTHKGELEAPGSMRTVNKSGALPRTKRERQLALTTRKQHKSTDRLPLGANTSSSKTYLYDLLLHINNVNING